MILILVCYGPIIISKFEICESNWRLAYGFKKCILITKKSILQNMLKRINLTVL